MLLAAAIGSGQGGGGGSVVIPYIGATATVDDTTGTPDVEVTRRGDDSSPIFDFAFSGLKGSGGGGALEEDLTVAKDVGGIKAGTVYPAGTPIDRILDDMLSPTLTPQLTDPKATLTYDVPSLMAVGEMVPAKTATVTLDRGRINPQYSADEPYRAGAATGYTISVNTSPAYNDSNTTGVFNIPTFTRAGKGEITITATASYGAGCQPKDSSGADYSTPLAAGSKSTTKKVKFVIPFRYGVVDSKTLSDLSALTADVTEKADKAYSFTTNNQYGVIAYDQSYGNLSKIYDQNNFDVTADWEQHVLGDSVYYVMSSPTTDTNAAYTFKF